MLFLIMAVYLGIGYYWKHYKVFMYEVCLPLEYNWHTKIVIIKYGEAFPEDNLKIAQAQGTEETQKFLKVYGLEARK